MTPRAGKHFRTSAQAVDLAITHRHAAGIDVHAAVHFVAVPVEDVPAGFVNPDAKLPAGVRKFGANTGDLEALAAWLKECGVTTVALESTGVFWIPLYDLLASRGFAVLLVDPRQTKHAPGRPKSDVLDCQWIRRLHSYGLLTASFRPSDQIVRWRGFQRQREMLIRYAAQHVQHLQKVLEEMNVKLTEVVSDIVGQTGMKIIKDIVRGERDAKKLAKHRHASCKASEAEIASALHGTWRREHLFALKQALKLYEFYQKQLRECETEIEACLRGMKDKSNGAPLPASQRQRKPEKNEVRFGARALLFRMAGVDVTQIEGISETTALVILSEIGTDLSQFPHEKNFVSWLGLCPQHRGSAGKIFKRRIRRGANRAARALRMAAQGCHHAKNALGAFYRRIQGRAGGPKAIVATARKIAERVYRMLKYGQDYVRQSEQAYEEAYQRRLVKSLSKKAASLGYKLVPQTMTP
ncbi:MAG TPA: IS110 family transposase [Hyphomicrobiaceae bacterium]|nr:IS110 family transposase [Hyphomicrobiaceae bacterium]